MLLAIQENLVNLNLIFSQSCIVFSNSNEDIYNGAVEAAATLLGATLTLH
jgi:hypothetical protein